MSVIHGDSIQVMRDMEPDSIDAICTDPPYGLSFMNKDWDSPGQMSGHIEWGAPTSSKLRNSYQDLPRQQAFHAAWATEALRVAKPGAYLLAFGGTRTVHRMTCAIEDAGWIIRDVLVWAYAQGFPKSRASLKPAWEPIVLARKPGPLQPLQIDAARIGYVSEDERAEVNARTGPNSRHRAQLGQGTTGAMSSLGERHVEDVTHPAGRWPANVVLTDPIFDGECRSCGRHWEGVVGGGEQSSTWRGPNAGQDGGDKFGSLYEGHMPMRGYPPDSTYGDTGTYSRFFSLPGGQGCYLCGRARSAETSSSQPSPSDASAPSPAPTKASSDSDITMGLPLTSDTETPSSPVARRGTSRTGPSRASRRSEPIPSPNPASSAAASATSSGITTTTTGRWTCASCVEAVMRSFMDGQGSDESPLRAYLVAKASRSDREPVMPGMLEEQRAPTLGISNVDDWTNGSGKPGKPGKRANVHPTVKPLELMRHLVRLVTPPGGTVLDPFAGSGTTLLAADQEGFAWVGIEREAEYVDIINARLAGNQRGLALAL